ncbi:gastrula zinc finger protein XlCGF8.2DB-like [Penaeus indicus]|uniref:gastrula zinc finger protein XlCGF8.2DB-like n=1 Tax=Penaeus indicus TaxID=29960 RepID=UPI00300C52FA
MAVMDAASFTPEIASGILRSLTQRGIAGHHGSGGTATRLRSGRRLEVGGGDQTAQEKPRNRSGESPLYNFQIRQKAISCFRDFRMSRKSHTTAQKPFSCHVCGKVFGQKGHLFIHKNVHAEVRPFGCDTCGRRFTQKGNLLRHSLLHTNEKPFGCGICRKFFVQKAHLVKHVVVHRQRLAALRSSRRREASERWSSAEAKETSLRCKVCGLQFRRISKLMEHLKFQHILGRKRVTTRDV